MSDSQSQPAPDGSESQPVSDSPARVQVIESCPDCSGQVDVTQLSPFTNVTCPHCQTEFRVRRQLGNYLIEGMLGEGGMSQVFRANDVTLNRLVALKILHQKLSEDASLTAMFEREATLTASINHPNVVKVYTASSEGGYFYIAMELVDTVSIEQVIANTGAIPEARVLDMAYDVTNGLKAAYGEGLIHRDIKPGNMLVTNDGVAKLVDFGLAVHQGGADDLEELWATPFYVPPEQLDGKPDTFLGDIYSLGATFFHALAGKPPFEANTFSLEELKAIKAQPVSLKEAAPTVSKPTLELVEKMMSYHPEYRPQSYEELLDLIGNALEVVPGTTKKRSRLVESNGLVFSQGMKRGLIGGAIALMVGVLIIVAAVLIGNSDRDIDETLITGGERVMGGEGISAKFIAGRKALTEGKYSEAETVFNQLTNSKGIVQPTLGWVQFNQGLLHLLQGNELTARGYFSKLEKIEPFPDGASENLKRQQVFFRKIGALASDDLPVIEDDAMQFSKGSYQTLGLLVCGLKNWNHGEFAVAGEWLKNYADSPVSAGYEWTKALHITANQFVDDANLIKTLPRPTGDTSSEDLKAMEGLLTEAVVFLKTAGVAPRFVNARIRRCVDLEAFKARAEELSKLAVVERSASNKTTMGTAGNGAGKPISAGDLNEAEKQEIEILKTAIAEAESLASSYEFTAALLKVESVTVNTGRGKAVHNDLLTIYKQADAFLNYFVSQMAIGGFDGIVRRRQGVPLTARITAATRDVMTVNLGFGDNPVEMKNFDPDWIREAAEQTFLTKLKTPPVETPDVWQGAAAFSVVSGLAEHAVRLANETRPVDSDYNDLWGRISEVEMFGLMPPPPPEEPEAAGDSPE